MGPVAALFADPLVTISAWTGPPTLASATFRIADLWAEGGAVCFPLWWVVAASLWTYYLMGRDKRLAQRGRGGTMRVRESMLLSWAIVGGAPGGWIAMYRFRHKTLRMSFRLTFPLFAIVWLVTALHLCGYLPLRT